jgi:hypothetical protein
MINRASLSWALLVALLIFVSLFAGTFGGTSSTTMFPSAQGVIVNDLYGLGKSGVAQSLYAENGIGHWTVPSCYDAWYVQSINAHVTTASSAGTPTFQVYNITQSKNLLDVPLTVDATETDSKTALVAASLYTTAYRIYSGDTLRLDCTTAGTDTAGAQVRLVIQPNAP